MKPLILDLYCGGGGAGMGYYRAGFEVVGVDIHPQPHYPFWFHRRDALEFIAKHGHEFDAIHASPPCQRYTSGKALHGRETDHVDLVAKTRAALRQSGKPFIIENVAGSPLFGNLMLCGSMFGLGYEQLGLRRHRIFECVGFEVGLAPFACNHARWTISIFGDHIMGGPKNGVKYSHPNEREKLGVAAGRIAMGIDWMTHAELKESIPPAYTQHIGKYLLDHLAGAVP